MAVNQVAAAAPSYAIVAIPREDDYVWRISSEKVPHLTLCVLGKLDDPSKVAEFVGHVADTSLCQFMLEVGRRGVLGDKSADVLFFGKYDNYDIKKLEDFRTYLLSNTDIFKAYNSTEQYDSWTPHLTLGYPETPAKPDTRDYPGLGWVNFDRIALWTGEYEGVEFPLKKYDGYDMAMSVRKGEDFLEHYGVKGMHWGVRKAVDAVKGNAAVKYASASEDHKRAVAVKTKAKVAGVQTLTNKDLQDVITRMNLEVNYKGLKEVQHAQSYIGKGKKWAGNFITDVLKDAAASWLKRPGSNFSGRTSATAYTWGHQVAGALASPNHQKAIGS